MFLSVGTRTLHCPQHDSSLHNLCQIHKEHQTHATHSKKSNVSSTPACSPPRLNDSGGGRIMYWPKSHVGIKLLKCRCGCLAFSSFIFLVHPIAWGHSHELDPEALEHSLARGFRGGITAMQSSNDELTPIASYPMGTVHQPVHSSSQTGILDCDYWCGTAGFPCPVESMGNPPLLWVPGIILPLLYICSNYF